MTRNERELKAVETEMARFSQEIQAIWKKAEDDDRETSNDERGEVEDKLKAIDQLKAKRADVEASIRVEQDVKKVGDDLRSASSDARVVSEPQDRYQSMQFKTVGEQFVESEGFKSIQNPGARTQTWSSGKVSVGFEGKGTLLEGTPGSGAGLIPVPQVIPGVVEKLFQPLTISDLLLSGQTTTNLLRYIVEGTATSGAAGVAEGGLKPESIVGLSTIDEPVKKIATILPISDEMLEDAPQVQSYVNGRLSLFVRIEEERQLLSGSTTDEVKGLLGRTGVNTYARGTVDDYATALFKAMNGTRGSAFIEPNFIVLNPTDWQTVRLAKDTAGQFMGGGPFLSPYGGAQGPVPAGSQLSQAQDQIWMKPVVITPAIGAGTALVGTTSAAQVWRRGGVDVEATNSHQDYFQRNLTAIRAEERLALAVYRPVAFTKVVF